MNLDALTPIFLKTLGYNLPAMIMMVIGMAWTYTTWRRHPPAARWALFGFGWMLFAYCLAIFWHTFGPLLLVQNNLQFDDQTPYLLALSCCEGLGYLFLMLALNAARYPYRSPQFYEHFSADDDPPRAP